MENLGVAEDPRTIEEKAKDYQHKDVAGDVILEWKEKLPSEWKKYTPREQDGSLSCVAQATAKAAEILKGNIYSAHPIYRARANFPGGGMYPQNCGDIWRHQGTALESEDPSQNQNEATMNRDVAVLTPHKMGGYAFCDPTSIEEIAEAVELHKQCTLLIACNKDEWESICKYKGGEPSFRHQVCVVDYFLYNGEKALLIEDSVYPKTTISQTGQRILTVDFISKRCEQAMYLIPSSTFIFTKTLRYGMKGVDVEELQKKLKSEGDFPQMNTTQYFGKITLASVKKYQTRKGLAADGIVGPLTRAKLNM